MLIYLSTLSNSLGLPSQQIQREMPINTNPSHKKQHLLLKEVLFFMGR